MRPVPAVPFDNPDNYNHQVTIVIRKVDRCFISHGRLGDLLNQYPMPFGQIR